DASPDMLAAARTRVAREGLADRIRLVRGDAASLSFRAGAFDFVTAVQVYLYVAEIEHALADAARVLRSGGRLVVVDTDWDSCVWLTADRARHRRVMEAREGEFAQPHLPPRLPGLLRGAGLRLARAEAIPVLDVDGAPGSFSRHVTGVTRSSVIRHGLPADEAAAWESGLLARTGQGDYFSSVTRYCFVAAKP